MHPPHLLQGKLLSTVGLVTKAQELHYTLIQVQQKLKSAILGWRHSSCLVSLAICSTLVFVSGRSTVGSLFAQALVLQTVQILSLQPGLCISVKQISPWKTYIWI